MTLDPRNPNLTVGQEIHGFKVLSIDPLDKLSNVLIQLQHSTTGAKMIHLSNEDDNNLFSVAFPTTPQDSTGVAHILEHTALCGSRNFDVRDPFFSMIKRSLKTFMNAFTASDWTMYPFSTQNTKDFYNLMEIYLDAAFFPKLSLNNFRQEGHRVEFETPDDANSDLVYKGVVYNEMLGAMSSQGSIMHRSLGTALFPSLTYKHNSGGDPEKIVDLTHEELLEFHRTHYHPSNSYFITYGNLDLAAHLEKIQNYVLKNFEALETHTAVPRETRRSLPETHEVSYPLSKEENDGKKNQVLLAWLTGDIQDSLEVLSMQILNSVLLGSAAAPLRKKLIESKLGKSLADGTGYEDEIRECYFAVGMQGVAEENNSAVEALVLETLAEIAEEGIDPELIESAIHQMEMATREISGGHYPYSINLMFRFFGAWMHGGDPLTAIDFDQTLEDFRAKLAEGNYLEGMIKTFFLENQHRATLILRPDEALQQKRDETVKEHLAVMKAGLSEEEKEAIMTQAKALSDLQEEEEDLSCLPTLELSDIPTDIQTVAVTSKELEGKDITFYEQPTNGLFYAKLFFTMPELTDEEQTWLPLLGSLLTGTGSGGWTYDQQSKKTSLYTGGFSAGPNLEQQMEPYEGRSYFTVQASCLDRNVTPMFDLLERILTGWNFEEQERVQSIVEQKANAMENSVASAGHQYAAGLAVRGFSEMLHTEELYDGVSQLELLRKLAKLSAEELQKALEPFKEILRKVLRSSALSVLAIGSQEAYDSAKARLTALFSLLEGAALQPKQFDAKRAEPVFQQEAWLLSTPVSYVTRCFVAPNYRSEKSPKLTVFSNLLKASFLHGEIREKGGAYGGVSSYNSTDGIFVLMSYRDPQLARTLDVYTDALEWTKEAKWSDDDLKEAILQACSKLDTPLSPSAKATREYIIERQGKSVAKRQAFRTGLIGTTLAELKEVGTEVLSSTYSSSVVTSPEILERDAEKLKEPLEKHSI